jgi:hypothetical protein
LQAHGHSRKETAAIVGVRPETISVWKRHPQWQLELQRWRKLAEAPLDKTQQRLQLEAAEATIEALALLRLIMARATKGVRTPTGIQEEPDWRTQLKACRLVLTTAFAAIPELAPTRARRDPTAARFASCPDPHLCLATSRRADRWPC